MALEKLTLANHRRDESVELLVQLLRPTYERNPVDILPRDFRLDAPTLAQWDAAVQGSQPGGGLKQ